MDPLQSLQLLASDNLSFFSPSRSTSGTSRRFCDACAALLRHGRHLGPAVAHLSRVAPDFDLDEATPGNGYRSLLQVVHECLQRAVERSRFVATHRGSLFFRGAANAAELEALAAALAQLRALLALAARMAQVARGGCLFPDGVKQQQEEEEEEEEEGISEVVLREYSTMQNGCFYGRCLGFQFVPSLRPFLQTLAIGLVSFGENYRSRDPGIGVAAGSLFTSGKFALDPELRGAEFERLTQNLDVHFWKSFWNLTETELLASVASLAAVQVGRVPRPGRAPPSPWSCRWPGTPSRSVTIAPPGAHTGPGPVHLRLLSYHLRQGQVRLRGRLRPIRASSGQSGPIRASSGQFGPIRERSRQIWANSGKFGPIRANSGTFGQIWANSGQFGPIRANLGKFGPIRKMRASSGQSRANSGQFGKMRANSGQFGPIRERSGQFRPIWANSGQFGPIRERSGKFGPIRANSGQFRQIRANLGTFGPIRANPGAFGPIWANL
ncbi:hormone-sensitive lipase, partial [Corvus hawaiiensis]|uniref:hormone-sensitive lipase n=1 Tax=Corvus hawaiiensis TaxID=134902 RepID=UPI002019BF92